MSARDIIFIGVALFAFGLGFLILHYVNTTIDTALMNNTVFQTSNKSVESLQASVRVLDRLDYVVFGIFIGLTFALLISSYLIGGNPVLMFFYFIVVIIITALSAVFANVWYGVSTEPVFAASILKFPLANNLLLNLPYYMAVIGFVGIVIMFAKPAIQDRFGGGGVW